MSTAWHPFFRNWATVQVLSRSGATSNFIRKRCGCAHPIFFEFPAMWVKQYHVYHPPVITIFIGGMWLPFPVMGGLWLFYPHYTYRGFSLLFKVEYWPDRDSSTQHVRKGEVIPTPSNEPKCMGLLPQYGPMVLDRMTYNPSISINPMSHRIIILLGWELLMMFKTPFLCRLQCPDGDLFQ
jgi:hypothetical protein